MESAISLPFNIDPYGNVASTTDQSKIWADRVLSVIGPNLRERVMIPDFGTLVPTAFMETVEDASSLIQTEVQHAFSTQLTLLTLQKVNINFDEYEQYLNVNIIYSLPNSETVSTTVSLITVKGPLPATQENL
jgi:phage baseplate assembly protein W